MRYEKPTETIEDGHPGHKTTGKSTGAFDFNAEEEWFPCI
jgi:hypothetical protein